MIAAGSMGRGGAKIGIGTFPPGAGGIGGGPAAAAWFRQKKLQLAFFINCKYGT